MPSKRIWLERWEKENLQRQPSRSILVKFCKPEHNLLNGCQTIRFGSFQYYREMDPNFAGIADENEGRETILVNSAVGQGSQEAIETLEELTGIGAGNHYIQFLNINFATTFRNCYIWCCSRIPRARVGSQGLRFNEEYTSHYAIKDGKLLAKCLTQLLYDSIFRIPFEDSAREKLNQLSRQNRLKELQIGCIHQDVVYVDEKKSIIEHGEAFPYAKNVPREFRPIFVKTKKYSLDCESRFVFIFQHPQFGILQVYKEPYDLQILPDYWAKLPIAAL